MGIELLIRSDLTGLNEKSPTSLETGVQARSLSVIDVYEFSIFSLLVPSPSIPGYQAREHQHPMAVRSTAVMMSLKKAVQWLTSRPKSDTGHRTYFLTEGVLWPPA